MLKRKKVFKNVKLVKVCQNGHDNWQLFHVEADTTERKDPFFDFFAEQLLPGESSGSDQRNTRYNYTRWVAHFIDFMIEAVNYQREHVSDEMSGQVLARLIRKYPTFLAHANESGDPLVSEVAKRLKATPVSSSSQSAYIGAVNKYLDLSEEFNAILRELNVTDIDGIPLYSKDDLFPVAIGRVALSDKERFALTKNSMLAGVMSGGAKLREIAKLKPIKPIVVEVGSGEEDSGAEGGDPEEFFDNDAFPIDHAPRLIKEGFKSLRDKVLFCLLMACGCRLHEALLITWRDIDTARQIVKLRCPYNKSLVEFGGFFKNRNEVLDLPWKGRVTARTSLIEPFRTHFWRFLGEYQQSKEFTITNSHNFVFQVIRGKNKGAPVIMSDHKNISKAMVKACKKIGVAAKRPHSLRHMYGVYCLNYIPFDDGTFGMGLLAVKDLMGHTSTKSTERYAIPDVRLQMMRQKMNFAALSNFTVDTSSEMRLELLKQEFKRLEVEIAREKELLEEQTDRAKEIEYHAG